MAIALVASRHDFFFNSKNSPFAETALVRKFEVLHLATLECLPKLSVVGICFVASSTVKLTLGSIRLACREPDHHWPLGDPLGVHSQASSPRQS
jgi:hypothetical protein